MSLSDSGSPSKTPSRGQAENGGRRISSSSKRARQRVSTVADKERVLRWMTEEFNRVGDEKGLMVGAVDNFPDILHPNGVLGRRAALEKVRRWWKSWRANGFALPSDDDFRVVSINGSTKPGSRRPTLKVVKRGRGRKVEPWTISLRQDVKKELSRLQCAGLSLNRATVTSISKAVLSRGKPGVYASGMLAPRAKASGDTLESKLGESWTSRFCSWCGLMARGKGGELKLAPELEVAREQAIAYHLGFAKRSFDEGQFVGGHVGVVEETHFVFDMSRRNPVNFFGTDAVQSGNTNSVGERVGLMFTVTGGEDARIGTPCVVFDDPFGKYPIPGVPDDVPGVVYRTQGSSWLDEHVLLGFLGDSRVLTALSSLRHRILFAGMANGASTAQELRDALNKSRTTLRSYPLVSPELSRPYTSFAVRSVRAEWIRLWGEYGPNDVEHIWLSDGSGKLSHAGKTFLMRHAANVISNVNSARETGTSIAKKAMMQHGLCVGASGKWEVEMLADDLKSIIEKWPAQFGGTAPPGTPGATQ